MKVLRQASNILRTGNTVAIQKLIGNGLKFDGVNDYCIGNAGSATDFNSADSVSVRAIFRPQGLTGVNCRFCSGNDPVGPFQAWRVYISSTSINFTTYREGGSPRFFGCVVNHGGEIKNGELFDLVITKSTGTSFGDYSFYLNGVKRNYSLNTLYSVPTSHSFSPSSANRIGVDGNNANNFNGTIYTIQFWPSTELSETEVFNLTKGQNPMVAPAQHYDFNQTRGTVLPDVSGNGHDGTLNGFSSTTDYGQGAWVNSNGQPAK